MREYSPQNISVRIKSRNKTGVKIDVVFSHMCVIEHLCAHRRSFNFVCDSVLVSEMQTLTFSSTLFGPECFKKKPNSSTTTKPLRSLKLSQSIPPEPHTSFLLSLPLFSLSYFSTFCTAVCAPLASTKELPPPFQPLSLRSAGSHCVAGACHMCVCVCGGGGGWGFAVKKKWGRKKKTRKR